MSKISEVRAQLEKQAKPQEPAAKTKTKDGIAKSREGKIHIGAYLDPAFRKSLRMVQAQTDLDIQEILAQALNDLFRKYNVTVVDRE
ncbi:MAG: hypothetical protein GPJ22_20975 [Microcystis aeruginosa LL13-03]|jgi:hypothetical protein|nr:hypothetical protein [Microcystis aeruginosa LL13-03]NCS17929.1 hypothetical protein [Microcystis aeruginosa G13-12]NCS21946.1 hypothetical protein [Microcystis aeruginosa G11-06]NCT53456.1 hypothetical protein [Microcystis aeruginosa G13-03]